MVLEKQKDLFQLEEFMVSMIIERCVMPKVLLNEMDPQI